MEYLLLEDLILEYIHKNHRTLRYNKHFLNILYKNIKENKYKIKYINNYRL